MVKKIQNLNKYVGRMNYFSTYSDIFFNNLDVSKTVKKSFRFPNDYFLIQIKRS